MNDRQKLLALIHVFKKELNLEDSEYRQILQKLVGVDSCKTLGIEDLMKVVTHFRRLKGKKLLSQLDRMEKRVKLANLKMTQLDLIYNLWNQLHQAGKLRDKGVDGLRAYVKRVARVDRPEWLSVSQKQKLIEMLKGWLGR